MAGWTGFTDEDLQAFRDDLHSEPDPPPAVKPSKLGQQARKSMRDKIMRSSSAKLALANVASSPDSLASPGAVEGTKIATQEPSAVLSTNTEGDTRQIARSLPEDNKKIGILSDEKYV